MLGLAIVTKSGKTGLIRRSTEIHFLSILESNYQALDNGLPGLLLQTAFYQCCKTMRVHFMVLGRVNRTTWGTKPLIMAVWASLVDCISSCHLLKAQHCSLSLNEYFALPLAPYPPPPPPLLPTHPL